MVSKSLVSSILKVLCIYYCLITQSQTPFHWKYAIWLLSTEIVQHSDGNSIISFSFSHHKIYIYTKTYLHTSPHNMLYKYYILSSPDTQHSQSNSFLISWQVGNGMGSATFFPWDSETPLAVVRFLNLSGVRHPNPAIPLVVCQIFSNGRSQLLCVIFK